MLERNRRQATNEALALGPAPSQILFQALRDMQRRPRPRAITVVLDFDFD